MTRTPLVAAREFIRATRDAGYRGPVQAVAELVDNSLQAGARKIDLRVTGRGDDLEISVLDDGTGMDADTLAGSLQFGGSSRFNDRRGLGRFGMGLPNSSLSQASRVEVYSWREGAPVLGVHLDADDVAEGRADGPAHPAPAALPGYDGRPHRSGTLVVWRRCDRLADRRPSNLRADLRAQLGSMFRHYLWEGVEIAIDGEPSVGADPLLVDSRSPHHGASLFGDPIHLELRGPSDGTSGRVTIRFAELPVHAWHGLSNTEKRRLGITKAGGVYVVRARREIDHGWFFMGEKRRENYDDWWRAEISFDPELDEAFGITNTKQQIRPARWLQDALTSELEPVARALNARVRRAHQTIKARERFASSETAASAVEGRMPPLPYPAVVEQSPLTERLGALFPDVFHEPLAPDLRLIEDDLGPAGVYRVILAPKRMVVILNTAHPFYRRAYAPLAESTEPGAVERRAHLELLLVSLARAEAASSGGATERHDAWAQILGELVRA